MCVTSLAHNVTNSGPDQFVTCHVPSHNHSLVLGTVRLLPQNHPQQPSCSCCNISRDLSRAWRESGSLPHMCSLGQPWRKCWSCCHRRNSDTKPSRRQEGTSCKALECVTSQIRSHIRQLAARWCNNTWLSPKQRTQQCLPQLFPLKSK